MDLKLSGKVALVTGAGSQIGFGKAICLSLAQEGCDIAAADIDLHGAELTASAVRAHGRKAIAVFVDVTDQDSVNSMVDVVLANFQKIDILINNAGASSPQKPFLEKNRDEWDYDILVNLYGQMNVIKAVAPHMMSCGYGRIINFTGGQGIPGLSVYGAAKAAIVAFSKALAKELAPYGITVNVVAPGLSRTGLTKDATEEFIERYLESSAIKRLCTPDDVAPVVTFLASDVCSYITGQVIRISAS